MLSLPYTPKIVFSVLLFGGYLSSGEIYSKLFNTLRPSMFYARHYLFDGIYYSTSNNNYYQS